MKAIATTGARRYAEEIILDPPEFDAIEVHPMSDLSGGGNLDDLEPASDSRTADAFSVFVHLVSGGVDCIGDFKKLDEALGYALEIADQFGWHIHDWTGNIIFTGESCRMLSTVVERFTSELGVRIIVIRDFDEFGEKSRRIRFETDEIETEEIELLDRRADGFGCDDAEGHRVRRLDQHAGSQNHIRLIDSN